MIGKKVKCLVPSRDEQGKLNGQRQVIVGVCNYLGPNQLLGEPLWTVIDRMPVALDSVKQIHEVSDKGGLAELCSDDFTSS